jgi:cytidine deaminase
MTIEASAYMRKISANVNLSAQDALLINRALDVSRHAYAPYSGFAVGAAVRTRSGKIYVGSNFENASYGLSMCGEVAALTAANTGGDLDVEVIAVVGHKFTIPESAQLVVTPCGRCRQLIFETSQVSNIDVRVLSCSGDLTAIVEMPISEMLPLGFGPKNLGVELQWPEMQSSLSASVSKLLGKR